MNVSVYKIKDCYSLEELEFGKEAGTQPSFERIINTTSGKCLCLDTLKVSNITESGPQKVFKAGLPNMPVIRHGKKVEMEIQDALGRLDTLLHFFGLKYNEIIDAIYSDDSFSEPLALEGEMKCIDLNGETITLYLFVPCFIPNGNLTIVQDSGSNVGVFNLNGELKPMKVTACAKDEDGEVYKENIYCYYLIQSVPHFGENMTNARVPIYNKDSVLLVSVLDLNENETINVIFDPTVPIYSEDFIDLVNQN